MEKTIIELNNCVNHRCVLGSAYLGLWKKQTDKELATPTALSTQGSVRDVAVFVYTSGMEECCLGHPGGRQFQLNGLWSHSAAVL